MDDMGDGSSAGGRPAERDSSRVIRRNQAFDEALGARIRALRMAAGLSQTVLGQAIGVSFQQVQKYELGKDRVSAGALQGIADALGLHPGTLFDDMFVPTGSGPDRRAAVKAGAVLQGVRDPRVLKRLLALAEVLGDGGGEESC